MPGIDFREARLRLGARGLGAALELLGFAPSSRRGDQVRGPCPIHVSSSPRSRSFAAHLSKGVWHCFGCGAGGNVLDLWAQATRQNLYEATIDLCRRLGRDVPWLGRLATIPKQEQAMRDP